MSGVHALLDQARDDFTRFQHAGLPEDISRAVESARSARSAAAEYGTQAQVIEADWLLGHACVLRYQVAGTDPDDLDTAQVRLHAVVREAGAPADLRFSAGDALAMVLQLRHAEQGNTAYLHEALKVLRQQLSWAAALTDGEGCIPATMGNIGVVQALLAQAEGSAELAGSAVDLLRGALDLTPEGDVSRSHLRTQLANAERIWAVLRADLTTGGETVDTLVEEAVEAVHAVEEPHPDAPVDVLTPGAAYLHYSNALSLRFEARGDLADLEEAEATITRALALTPDTHVAHPLYLMARGTVALRRYLADDDAAARDRAIADMEDSVGRLPADSPDRHIFLSNLARAVQFRYQDNLLRTDDLVTALGHAEEASRLGSERAATSGALVNLAVLRVLMYEHTRSPFTVAPGSSADGLRAAELTLDRLDRELPEDHPAVANTHHIRGYLYRAVYRAAQDQKYLDGALDAYAAAAHCAAGPLAIRVVAARDGGLLASSHSRWPRAAELLTLAVELLEPMTEPTLLGWESRAEHLEQFGGIANRACAVRLNAGSADEALAVLDRGRGVLLAPAWSLRSCADSLPADEARRYREAMWSSFAEDRVAEAATTSNGFVVRAAVSATPAVGTGEAERRRARNARQTAAALRRSYAAVDLDALCGRLGTAAAVTVNVAEERSDAFVTTASGTHLVQLPGLKVDEVWRQAARLQDAVSERSVASVAVCHKVTRWLWDVLAEPVLDRLGSARVERLWWIPTGPLCLLPLHAAGHHQDPSGCRTVLDRVVSSYSATLHTLAQDLARPTEPVGPALLVAPGSAGRLPPARVPAPLYAAPGPVRLLEREAARQTVLEQLPGKALVHFACHGRAVPDDPAESSLLMADGQLSFADIARTDLEHSRFAFLAACETAWSGRCFPNEAIHLGSAFQLAGFPHVVATLWEVYPSVVTLLTETVYAELAQGAQPAKAVHRAVIRIRDEQTASGLDRGPLAWAPYIHLGV
ncbi:CHAT domain-containing protein [Streptomyces sp. NPDC052236]|uniref:CHAT domain-containing protein n=1 Tax=Streptomyces sp. NPDC052236 TaxID=3365686 RepID=UPI0037D714E5